MSRPRNSPTISTVSTSLSASTGVGPRWRGLRSWQRSRTKSSTRQNTATIRVSRSMAVPRFDSAVARNGPAPPGYPQPPSCSKTRTPGQLGRRPVQLTGIHHLTAVTADAPGNHAFYTGTLGMRLVKKTVNQDDVSAYHLFYADAKGSPGTDLTFFDWPVERERRGTHSIARTGLRVSGAAAL